MTGKRSGSDAERHYEQGSGFSAAAVAAPMQVRRRHPVHPSTMARNRAYWALPGVKGTVWEHYMLVASQWPVVTKNPDLFMTTAATAFCTGAGPGRKFSPARRD